MYFTYVIRPAFAPEGKGPQPRPCWDGFMELNLRAGFALQLIGYSLILIGSLFDGQLMFRSIGGDSDSLKKVPIFMLFVGTFFYTIGAVCLQNFANLADDDASINQTRGFRAGIKALHQASLFDILSWAMTAMLLFSYMQYFDDELTIKTVGSRSTAIYASTARIFHACGLLLYSIAFFMLECFHREGTTEFWGWLIASFYKIAGLFEILTLTLPNNIIGASSDFVFSLCFGLGLLSALCWSMAFEPVIGRAEVKLTQSAMRNEYFKSQNATAYYGPASGIGR